jgi:hypothetical protein
VAVLLQFWRPNGQQIAVNPAYVASVTPGSNGQVVLWMAHGREQAISVAGLYEAVVNTLNGR